MRAVDCPAAGGDVEVIRDVRAQVDQGDLGVGRVGGDVIVVAARGVGLLGARERHNNVNPGPGSTGSAVILHERLNSSGHTAAVVAALDEDHPRDGSLEQTTRERRCTRVNQAEPSYTVGRVAASRSKVAGAAERAGGQ